MFSLRVLLFFTPLAVFLLYPLAVSANPDVTGRARRFLEAHTHKLRPLEIEASRAWWDANTTGKPEDFDRKEKTQNRIDEALADPLVFANVKKLHDEHREIDDPILAGPSTSFTCSIWKSRWIPACSARWWRAPTPSRRPSTPIGRASTARR